MRRHLLCALAAMALLTACDDVSCPLNNSVASIYNFYASARDDSGTFAEGSAVSVGDSITISAMDLDSVLVNRLYGVSTVTLPMSFYNAADSLLWTFTDSRSRKAYDTIVIYKTNRHHFDDPSCPAHMWHHIDSVAFSRNLIDTIIVATPDVNYDGLENFQIYFRVATAEEETGKDDETDETEEAEDSTNEADEAEDSTNEATNEPANADEE